MERRTLLRVQLFLEQTVMNVELISVPEAIISLSFLSLFVYSEPLLRDSFYIYKVKSHDPAISATDLLDHLTHSILHKGWFII